MYSSEEFDQNDQAEAHSKSSTKEFKVVELKFIV